MSNRLKQSIAFFCVFVFCVTSFAATRGHKVMDIQNWKTSNGAAVYFVRVPSLPMLDVRVVFSAGSVYDGKRYGLASLTNSMIGERTETQNADQIAQAFDNVGAQFNVGIDRDMAMVSLRSLTEAKYLNPALSEFSNVLTKALFPLKALHRIKNRAIATIKVGQQEPGQVASNAFYAAIYGNQAYAHDPLGTVSNVKRTTRGMLEKFYKRYYVAKNTDIIIVGDLKLKQAKRVASRISKNLPTGKHAKTLGKAALSSKAKQRHIPFPAKQTSIVLGQVGITRNNPDYFPLVVGNYVLGGLPLSSILMKQVRIDRGLAYGVGSSFRLLQYRGPFIISLKTRADKSKEALQVVQQVLRDYVAKGPTVKQLNAAKQNMIGSFPLGLATNSSITNIVTRIAFYHRPLDFLDNYRAKVRAVTRQQVKAAFEKIIHPNKMVIVFVGPNQ